MYCKVMKDASIKDNNKEYSLICVDYISLKKKYIFSIFFFLVILYNPLIFGQNIVDEAYTVSLSSDQKLDKKWSLIFSDYTDLLGFVKSREHNHYLIKSVPKKGTKYRTLVLDEYDSMLNLISQKELNLNAKAKNAPVELENFYSIKGVPVIFYSQFDSKNNTRTFYYKYINLAENDKNDYGALLSFESTSKYRGDYDINISTDSSKIIVVVTPPQQKSENFKQIIYVYNDKLNLEREQTINHSMPKTKTQVTWFVTNSGVPINFVKQQRIKPSKQFGKMTHTINIYTTENETKSLNVDIETNDIRDLVMLGEGAEAIAFNGITCNRQNNSISLGLIFISLDVENYDLLAAKNNLFSETTAVFFGTKLSKLKKGGGINFLNLKQSGVTTDGNFYSIISNDYYLTSRNTNSIKYVSGCKIVSKYNKNGQLLFEKIVPNLVVSSNSEIGTYFYSYTENDNIYLIYNATQKSIANAETVKKATKVDKVIIKENFLTGRPIFPATIIVLEEINTLGKSKKFPLVSSKEKPMVLENAALFYQNNEFTTVISDENNYTVLKVQKQ